MRNIDIPRLLSLQNDISITFSLQCGAGGRPSLVCCGGGCIEGEASLAALVNVVSEYEFLLLISCNMVPQDYTQETI